MTYESFNQVSTPDDGRNVWRYMGLAQFISAVQNNGLHFSSMRSLSESDPYEAEIPKVIGDKLLSKFNEQDDESVSLTDLGWLDFYNHQLDCLYVNCWYSNDVESEAMWKIHGYKDRSVCIKSTASKLKKRWDPLVLLLIWQK